jgi:hypothetical protein
LEESFSVVPGTATIPTLVKFVSTKERCTEVKPKVHPTKNESVCKFNLYERFKDLTHLGAGLKIEKQAF